MRKMSSDRKEESCSPKPDTKMEEDSTKEDSQSADESSMVSESKENDKDIKKEDMKEESEKEGSVKDESDKEDSDKEDSDKERSGKENEKDDSEKEESEDEEKEIGLLDRPVEVSGCRARKQVQRLEVSFPTPSKGIQIPDGKGQKLGEIPAIEHQISKYNLLDLKPLHRILFSKPGTASEIKKNIRKFSGFAFSKNSHEFESKKSSIDKLTSKVLKTICEILLLEKSGTKDDIEVRIMEFLVCPTNSGKMPPKKKAAGQDKKKGAQKKIKKNGKKTKSKASDDEVAPSDSEESHHASEEEDNESDSETKKKSKAKGKKNTKVKITAVKIGKPKTQPEKGTKRKKDAASDSDDDDEKPPAKKSTSPDDDEIVTLIKKILEKADLQEITMKKVIKQVFDTYPECDLLHKKAFIKKTIKSVIT